MLKQLLQMEMNIDGKSARFLCDNDLPLPHAKEAIMQFLKYINDIEDAIKVYEEKTKSEKLTQTEEKLSE